MASLIVVIGSPGSGKGSLCHQFAIAEGYFHISTGDIFRHAVTQRSELGLKIDEFVQKDLLVSKIFCMSPNESTN